MYIYTHALRHMSPSDKGRQNRYLEEREEREVKVAIVNNPTGLTKPVRGALGMLTIAVRPKSFVVKMA
jgi:hypothetical protein